MNSFRFCEIAFCRVDAVFAVFELDQNASRVSDGSVALDFEILKGVDETPLEVTGLGCTDGCVDETLAAADGVEEEFRRGKAVLVTRFHETVRVCAEIALGEVRQRSAAVTSVDTGTTNGLLTDTGSHLRNVENGTSGT